MRASPVISVRAIEQRNWTLMAATTLVRMLVIYAILLVLADASIGVQALSLALVAELYLYISITARR